MTLPVQYNQIALDQVNTELTLAYNTQISLGQTNVRTLAGVASGQISLHSLHGKTRDPVAPTYISAGTMGYGWYLGNTADCGVPAGYAAGDLFVLFIGSDTPTAPSVPGWTVGPTSGNVGNARYVFSFYKFASSGESTYSHTCNANTCAGIMCFRGVNTTSPIDSSAPGSSAATTYHQHALVTSNYVNCQIAIGTNGTTSGLGSLTASSLTDFGQRGTVFNGRSPYSNGYLSSGLKSSAGSCGNLIGSTTANSNYTSLSLAIRGI